MRKKYLSALLFGALLLASAGTFTSCKDYDDDIKNLQEQINTVKTSLDELTSKVNSLGAGVKEFKYENGKLILVTDKDTNFEVELPACDGIKELEIKNGILYADDVEVGPIGGEGTTIEGDKVEVKDGILYINDEPQDLKDEVGSKVIVIDNNDGTYTLTVGSDSYVLPKASASIGIISTDQVYFTNLSYTLSAPGFPSGKQDAGGGILWGTGDFYRGDWKGLKPVSKGQLLVGQISTVQVKVNAATFDLETAKLTLVNTLGEEAPVTVTPVAQGKKGPAVGNSRAADANGVWNLKVEMKNDVTASNIATAFAAKDSYNGYAYKNVKYALAVDGKVATDYIYYVDTDQAKVNSSTKFSFEDGGNATTILSFVEDGLTKNVIEVKGNGRYFNNIPIGTSTTLKLSGITDYNKYLDRIYDSYIEIKDIDLAEKHGITAEGMTLNVSANAAALTEFPITIHVLDINGNEVESEVLKVNFASSVAPGQELQDQAYTIIPSTNAYKNFVLVDLGNTFTGLTADEAVAISTDLSSGSTGKVEWYSVTDNKLFSVAGTAIDGGLKPIVNNQAIKYYATKEDALKYGLEDKKDVTISFSGQTVDVKAATIRKIAYAVVPVSLLKSDATPDTKAPFTVILKDKDQNEIRRVSAQYTINLPSFDDVLEVNSDQNLWKDGTFTTRVSAVNNGQISLVRPFKSKTDGTDAYIDLNQADGRLYYDLEYTDFADKKQYVTVNNANATDLTGIIVKDNKLVQNIDVTATLYLFKDVNGVKYPNFKLTKEFKVYLQSVFEGASISYYVGGKAVEGAMTLEDGHYIYGGVTSNGKPGAGMFITYDGETIPCSFFSNSSFTNGVTILDSNVGPIKSALHINKEGNQTEEQVNPFIYLKDGSVGQDLQRVQIASPFAAGSQLDVLDLVTVPAGASGSIEITFVDEMDVHTTVTLGYKK